MAVISVKPLFTWLEPSNTGIRNYKIIFQVITNACDGPVTVAAATGLPSPGDSYSWGTDTDNACTCDPVPEIRLAKQDEGYRNIWNVTCNYTNEPRPKCIGDDQLNEWDIEGDSDEWEDIIEIARDANGNGPYGITNTALERITPHVPKTRRNLMLKKSYTWIIQDWIGTYEGSVNSVGITILGKAYPPRTLRIRRISFTRKRVGACDNYVYPVTFNIDIDFNTFDLIIPNTSHYHRLPGAPSPPTIFIDHLIRNTVKDETRVGEPQYIDDNANIVAPNTNGMITPTYRRWRYFVELPFAIFNFPSSG